MTHREPANELSTPSAIHRPRRTQSRLGFLSLLIFGLASGIFATPSAAQFDCNCFCAVSLDPDFLGRGNLPPEHVYSFDESPKVDFGNCTFAVNRKEEECRRTCAATAASDEDRWNNDEWWCRELDRPFSGEITLYSKIGNLRWRVAGKRRVQCKRCCDCPRGSFDPRRDSCTVRVGCTLPGIPDGNKGGGYSAVGGQIFQDIPGATNCQVTPGAGACEPPCGDCACPDDLTATATITTREGCDRMGGYSATVTLDVSGGSPPFTVRQVGGPPVLGNPITGDSPLDVTGVSYGSFVFEVEDSTGETVTVPVEVMDTLQLTLSSTPTSCETCSDGTAQVVATGGQPPFTYRWDDEDQQLGPDANGLPPGTYAVRVTDALGCSREGTVSVDAAGN